MHWDAISSYLSLSFGDGEASKESRLQHFVYEELWMFLVDSFLSDHIDKYCITDKQDKWKEFRNWHPTMGVNIN